MKITRKFEADIASEHPVIFSDPMVRALLDGRKTQTRQVVRLNASGRVSRGGRNWYLGDPDVIQACPYQRGDLLWVRETYCLEQEIVGNEPPHCDGRPIQINQDAFDGEPRWVQPHYRATDPEPELAYEYGDCQRCQDDDPHAHWRPSAHMPRWASRITLRVTGVRAERLQDITADAAAAEGVQILVDAATGDPVLEIGSPYAPARYLTPGAGFDQSAWLRAHFASLWDGSNFKRGHGWSTNPFVWVVDFEVMPPLLPGPSDARP